jgi:ATP-binding cassette subfamily F protein 3
VALLNCIDVAVEYGDRLVFSGMNLKVEPGDRLGVVGANGAGKSSFLGLLAAVEEPSEGRVERSGRLIVSYLPQESPEPVSETVLGEAMASRLDLAALRDEMIHLEQQMTVPGPESDHHLARYGECQAAYEGMGGYELESKARAVLHGLGLEEDEQSRSPRELSVGQVRRMELAKLLLQDADLVLLDEPTNHLDLAAIEWLEAHLMQTARTLCLVAHDRRLLERVCTRVVELESQRVEVYEGSYDSYLQQRYERRLRWRRTWESQQAHITHQEEYIRRYKAGQRARQARGRQTLLDRLERVPEPTELRRMKLSLHATPSAQAVLRTEGLACGRDGQELFSVPDLVISRGDRVAILGANGSGKTTLLHTLVGDLEPVRGRVIRGSRAHLRLYRQDFSDLNPERTVLETLLDDHPNALTERARSALGAMLFSGDRAHALVGSVSGGEKARVALARLGMDDANCLLLDEPTNHLDIPAQEALEQSLSDYPGAVILVSHDRYFVEATASRILQVQDGHLVERPSRHPARPAGAGPVGRPKPQRTSPPSKRRGTAPALTRTQAERRISALEDERQLTSARLADPATHRDQGEERRLLDRLSEIEVELASTYAAWVELEGITDR